MPDWKRYQLPERLASLGIMGNQLSAPHRVSKRGTGVRTPQHPSLEFEKEV